MRAAGGFDEAVGHEGAGGDNRFDDAGFDEIAEDQPHFPDGESAGESHDDETVLIASHGFENVGSITDLSGGVGGVAHGADEIVYGVTLGQIEGKDGAEFVFDGIVKNATRDCFIPMLRHRGSS